jgi:hypothetical protein
MRPPNIASVNAARSEAESSHDHRPACPWWSHEPAERTAPADLLEATCLAFFAVQNEAGQISRALRQYELALRE